MGAALDREMLAKLCGMFGSDHAGERANAAAAADKLVRQAGLRWPDVILPLLPAPPRKRDLASLDDVLRYCDECADALTPWERQFAASLRRQRSPISGKQAAILDQIIEKLRRAQPRSAA
jgi:hypothetical protein